MRKWFPFNNSALNVINLWLQSFIAITLATHIRDILDSKILIASFVAAFIPVLLRWSNSRDSYPKDM
jgi:hypothetical protein